jgi:hypothetical protein
MAEVFVILQAGLWAANFVGRAILAPIVSASLEVDGILRI